MKITAKTKWTGLVASFLGSLSVCHAIETDLGVTGFARANSLAGIVEGQAGASQLLWGDSNAGPMFGYIRASGTLRSSIVTNGYRAQFEAYPVSFLGVTAGAQGLHRLAPAPAIDCDIRECKGWVQSNYIQARAVFRAGEFFGQAYVQRDVFLRQEGKTLPIFEPMMMLGLASAGDQVTTWNAVLGYQLTPEWSGGVVYMTAESDKTREKTLHEMLFARWKPAEITYNLAIGRVNSNVVGVGPQVLLSVAWWPKARIGY